MQRLLILILFFFSGLILAQNPNWSSVKETNINIGSALSFDIFTNQDGNHIIVQESNSLKYYKMNLNGQAGSPITLESVSVVSPSITGDGTRLYVVYRRSSETFVRTRVSTNGGSSWSYLSQNPPNSNGSNIESALSNNNLHITFQEGNSVYYSRKYILDGSAWTSRYTVSNTETASAPRIASWSNGSADEVFFVFKTSSTAGKWRKYNVAANQWSNIFNGYSVSSQDLMTSGPAGLTVGSDEVRYYYYHWTYNTPFFNYIAFNKNGGVSYNMYPEAQYTTKVHNTVTFDGVGHTAHWVCWCWLGEGGSEEFEQGIWRSKNSDTTFIPMDLVYWNENQQPVYDLINLSSGGNEVHVIWKDNLGINNGNNLRYRWDNQNPIAPQNLTMSSHNNHPKLIWNKNPELDIDYYAIHRKKGTESYSLLTTVSASLSTQYVDNEETICTVPPPAQCQNEVLAKYKITAIDLTDKVSEYSNEVEARLIGGPPEKIVADNSNKVLDYELGQNYPNPFNPVTIINYQIKEKGFVTLKIYDILGKEVSVLVNEETEAGQYSVVFNSGSLPSGVYVYSLRVNDFIQNNTMTLLK